MNILIITGRYPFQSKPHRGIILEKNTLELSRAADQVVVLSPRLYIFPLLRFNPKWKKYCGIPAHYFHSGVEVYRPYTVLIPRIFLDFWRGEFTFRATRRLVDRLHKKHCFDAVFYFDIVEAGNLAWRIGKHLGIPTAGWAFGSDIYAAAKNRKSLPAMVETIISTDLLFYQSRELKSLAAELMNTHAPGAKFEEGRHIVLPHGIPLPAELPDIEKRMEIRRALNVRDDQLLLLYIGRIVKEKGAFDILQAMVDITRRRSDIVCVMIGQRKTEDQSLQLLAQMDNHPALKPYLRLLPFCPPEKVWEYYKAADIFAFASYHEGMPNSLLEAMYAELPAAAYDIEPVREIKGEAEGVILTSPLRDTEKLAEIIEKLADNAELRERLGREAKQIILERFSLERNMAEAYQHLQKVVA